MNGRCYLTDSRSYAIVSPCQLKDRQAGRYRTPARYAVGHSRPIAASAGPSVLADALTRHRPSGTPMAAGRSSVRAVGCVSQFVRGGRMPASVVACARIEQYPARRFKAAPMLSVGQESGRSISSIAVGTCTASLPSKRSAASCDRARLSTTLTAIPATMIRQTCSSPRSGSIAGFTSARIENATFRAVVASTPQRACAKFIGGAPASLNNGIQRLT